jgi:putative oxygen-independent coproporphyrinogen III oxidase
VIETASLRAADAAYLHDTAPLRFERLPPLSLYVHLPWCVRKCPYCDFNSYEAKRGNPEEDPYVDALLRDLDTELEFVGGRPLASVFIGGGTPSLFSGAAIRRLLDAIRSRAPLEEGGEVTLEANPGAVDAARFTEYREAGVTRLSIGVQSFRAEQLRKLGRVHGPDEAARAAELAKAAGFDNFNLDLMYALPGDDVDGALADLASAISLAPPHLSWYQLTLEPNTAFHRRPPALPAEDLVLDIERRGRELLASAGFARYEVSAYERGGRRCVHNLNYWQFGDYLGLGAGAHGKVTLARDGVVARRAKTRNPRTFIAAAGTAAAVRVEHIAAGRELAVEFLMNALRLLDGVHVRLFEERTGQPVAVIEQGLRSALARGWLAPERDTLRPTAAGSQMLNPLLELFC